MRGQGPAYTFPAQPGIHDACLGLSKRELFAAMMMQGLIASNVRDSLVAFAGCAVQAADILLAELEDPA